MQNNFRFWKNLKLVWLCPFHTNHCLKSWPRNVHLWESILTSERSVNINLKANGKFKHQSNICSEKKNVCVWVFCFVVTTFCCGLFKDDSISSLTTSQAIPLWFPSCFDSRFPIPLRLPWDPDSRLPIPKAIPSCFDSRFPIPKAIPTRSDFRFPVPSSVPGTHSRPPLWLGFETRFRTRVRF